MWVIRSSWMSEERDFVVVSKDAVERELASKQTPRRPTEEDRRRAKERTIFCRHCHNWLVYTEKDVQERDETKPDGRVKSYCSFIRCVCGEDRVVAYSGITRAERNRRNEEICRERNKDRGCAHCHARPADHYCSVCDKFYCQALGCPTGEERHPTVAVPPELLPEEMDFFRSLV